MADLIDFAKIEATGNDFVFIDDKWKNPDTISTKNIQAICNRHKGIGADGIIFISVPDDKYPEMKYYNADGSLGQMCGNGMRAAALYGYLRGIIRNKTWQQIKADDGMHKVYMNSSEEITVEIKIKNDVQTIRRDELPVDNNLNVMGFINTGVPHLVLKTNSSLDGINVLSTGKTLRYHPNFQPEGTNVNFMEIIDDNHLKIRTYERGVENETLSCGTGIIAGVISYWDQIKSGSNQVKVSTLGGELNVLREEGSVFLRGPARVVFTGKYLNV